METLYSHREDDWDGSSEAIEEAAYCAFEDLTDEEVSTVKEVAIFTGTKKQQVFKDYLNVESFLEQMGECAYDNSGEFAEDYLDHVTAEQISDLENAICAWAEKHKIKPAWFMVEDVKESKFTIPQEWKDNAL